MTENVLELVKWKADSLLTQIDNNSDNIESEDILEVKESLEAVRRADSTEDIPRQVGGILFFKSVQVEKQFDIDGFASEYRKIHEALGRDADLEKRLIENEEPLDKQKVREIEKHLD